MLQSSSCSSSPNINSYTNRSPLVVEDSQQSSSSTSSLLFSTTTAVDLTKSFKSDILQSQSQHHPQQRTVICSPTIQPNPKQKPSVGMDLSLSSMKTTTTGTAAPTLPSVITGSSIQSANRLSTIESSSTNKNIPAPPYHSRQIKKVLKHYQAAATLSLNGPDWFLPIYSNGSSAGINCDGNGGSSIASSSSTSSPPPPPPVIVNSNDTTTATIWADKSGASNGGGGSIGSAPQVISSNFVDDNKIVADGCGSKSSLSTAAAAAAPPTSSLVDLRTNRHQQQQQPPPPPPSSLSSISSPSLVTVAKTTLKDYDPLLRPPPFPIQQPPLLTPPDHGDPKQSERMETLLEGELIACFMVGGERRLCVPQIFNIVLRDFALHQINQVIEELQINCSTCTRDQMDVLKHSGDIPPMAPSCGLITKTDAHRLCSTLLCNGVSSTTFHNNHTAGSCGPSPIHLLNTPYILIYHECFGRCVGRYAPSLYTHPSALCIQCDECMSLFTPYGFVCHSHRPRENRTVHWGFDPNNWRSYLLPIEDLVTYDSVVIPLNHQDALLTDTMNLSQIIKLINNNNQSPNGNDFKNIPPCCTGGWKSMACHQKPRANASFDKNLDQIRLIMKEMKNRFAKSLTTNPNGNALLRLSNKRKEMFQDVSCNQNRCLASNPETLSNSSQNKRIKSEPLDLHCPTGGGGGNVQPVSSSLMSSLVYPFLQSYLTSGMIPANGGSLKLSKPSAKPSSVDQSSIIINHPNSQTQRAPNTTSASATAATNYLSALLTGSRSNNTSTTITGNNSDSSSAAHNPSSIFADFMNQRVSGNQTSTAAEVSSVANHHKNNSQTAKLSKELASFFAATAAASPLSGHHHPFYSDGGQMLSDIGHYHANSSYHQQPAQQNSHPIDRLLNNHTSTNVNNNSNSKPLGKSDYQDDVGSQIAMIPKTKALIVNGEEEEEKCLMVEQAAQMVGDSMKTMAAFNSNQKSLLNQLQPKNCLKSSSSLSMNSSLLPETNVILSNSNNHQHSDKDDLVQKEQQPKFCSVHPEKRESSPNSLREKHNADSEEVDEKLGQISPTSLMEGNLYNTIHMLQKMRHLSFELGMVPNLFEPKSSNKMSVENSNAKDFITIQQAESEVETRIQMLGQIIKDSSYEALKRNLSMIEYLIDDILVHLINNNHQIPSNGSIIMERFKKRMFQNILDFLDEIFAEKVANNNGNKSSSQQQTHANNKQKDQVRPTFKMENIEDEEKYGFDKDGGIESSHADDVKMDTINEKNDKEENCIDKVGNHESSIGAEQEQINQDSSASQSSVQIIENSSEDKNELDSEIKRVQESSLPITQALISTERLVATPLSSSSSSLSSVSSPKPASPTTFNKNNDTATLIQKSINEQLTNAISTLAATVSAAAAAAAAASSANSESKSSANNNDINVPSFLYHLNQTTAASSSPSTGLHHFIGHHHHRMSKASFGDDHGLASVGDKGTTTPITTAAAATVTQQPMLLTTGSPN